MRIEIPAFYGLWMRGARCGEVLRTDKNKNWIIKMDHESIKRPIKIGPDDQNYCRVISL